MATVNEPRIELARLPTPIDHLRDLGAELGIELYVKRDDLTGAALSGNKVRKLEFVLARALEEDADVVITCGGAQSNHCRATAIAARRIGLDVELFLRDGREAAVDGNLFLDLLMGAVIHSIAPAEYQDRQRLMAARGRELGSQGRNAFIIPEGASDPLGSLGYVNAVAEILEQSDPTFDLLVTAVGSGGTLAGLIAGARLHGFAGRVLGVPVCDDAAHFERVVGGILAGMRDRFFPDLDPSVPPGCLLDGHVGEGYARATFEELERIRDVALLTGLILDPVYTNKAFGGLLSLVRSGQVEAGQRVLFLHTGGLFGLLPFRDRMPHLMVP